MAQTPAEAAKQFSHRERIRYDGHCLTIDDKDTLIRSAAFHYFRTPRELWHDRFQKIKDAGFNTVETYVPWNWHEQEMPAGLEDFSKVDLSEDEAWLKIAQDEFGFYTIVRPGPFICAEWAGGGYPRWLAKFAPGAGQDFWLRSADDAHIAWSVHWYNAACKGVQWEWNYQPRAEKWSLTERPGFLRLHAFKPLEPDNLKKAGNTLTQRALRTSTNIVTLALDLSGMAEGQVAGLCHYSRDYSTIGVRRENGAITLESAHNQTSTRGPALTTRKLWLRSTWGLDGQSQYAYSTNGTVFTAFGAMYRLGWGDYRGDRIGIFTYNNAAEAGYVDCDAFTYRYDSPATRVGSQKATASAK